MVLLGGREIIVTFMKGMKLLDSQFCRVFHRGNGDPNCRLTANVNKLAHQETRLRSRAEVGGRGGGRGVGYKVKGVQLTLWSLPTNLKTGTWKCFARWSRDVYCFTESSETQLKAGREST